MSSTVAEQESRIASGSPAANRAKTKEMVPEPKILDKSKQINWTELNMDKTKTQLVQTSKQEWLTTSQASGTARKLIERLGGEVARCTTYVKFQPNQGFPRHAHIGGEEFFVVDGVWYDDYGSFPKYSYLRNYIGSSHQPHMGPEGVEIMVKLMQMSETLEEPETSSVNAAPDTDGWKPLDGCQTSTEDEQQDADAGSSSKAELVKQPRFKVLYESALEKVTAVILPAYYEGQIAVPEKGKEVCVIDGGFSSDLGDHDKMAWCRLVRGDGVIGNENALKNVKAGDAGAYLYVKENHLESDEIGFPPDRMREFCAKYESK